VSSRVLVIGGGALGGVMAARLSRSGHDVTVLDANREHVDRMIDPGLEVDLVGEKLTVPLKAVSQLDDLINQYDFGLVTLKAPHIQSALAPLVERDLVSTYVSLGNGLVQDRIQDVVGSERLIVGTVSWGATNFGPGRVAQTTIAPFALGELSGETTPRLNELGELLSDVAEVHFTDNIQGQIWSKLLLNSTFSGLSVVTGLVYGDVMQLPDGLMVAMGLWTEGFKVAEAKNLNLDVVAGIEPREIAVLDADDPTQSRAAITRLMESLGPTKASMLQDVEKGLTTEVEVINGGVSSAGQSVGLPTPLNDAVVEIVHEYESGSSKPSPQHLSRLIPLTDTSLQL
jgi:2-dehydropantoate 2-reductase